MRAGPPSPSSAILLRRKTASRPGSNSWPRADQNAAGARLEVRKDELAQTGLHFAASTAVRNTKGYPRAGHAASLWIQHNAADYPCSSLAVDWRNDEGEQELQEDRRYIGKGFRHVDPSWWWK